VTALVNHLLAEHSIEAGELSELRALITAREKAIEHTSDGRNDESDHGERGAARVAARRGSERKEAR
jgi:hypothetical protein